MGSLCSKNETDYEMVSAVSTQNNYVSPSYTKRKPRDGEIEELAEQISLETFLKNRMAALKKIDDVELSREDAIMLVKALRSDTEKIEFLQKFQSNIHGLRYSDISSLLRSQSKRVEAHKLLINECGSVNI